MGILQPLWNLTASLAFGKDEAAHEQADGLNQRNAATTTTTTLLGAQIASRAGVEASVHAPRSGRQIQLSSSLSVDQTKERATRVAAGESSRGQRSSSSRKTRRRSTSHGRLRRPAGTTTRARSSTEPHLHLCRGESRQIASAAESRQLAPAPTAVAAATATAASTTAATAATTPSSAGRSSRVHDERYKTELCRNFEELGSCPYRDCLYAHGLEELRPAKLHPKHKTKLCKPYEESGQCNFGRRCRFIHRGENDASVGNDNARLAMPASPGPFPVPAMSLHSDPSLRLEPLLRRLGRPTAIQTPAAATTPAPPATPVISALSNSFRDLDSCWWSHLSEPTSAATSTASSTWSDFPTSPLDVHELSNALMQTFLAEPDQEVDKRTPKATRLPPAEPDPKHCNVL